MRYPRLEKTKGEDDIQAEKRVHYPILSQRLRNPEGFYSEDCDEEKQEEDEWQIPDKFQKISQLVLCNGVLESSQVTVFNTKGASVINRKYALRMCDCEEDINLHPR